LFVPLNPAAKITDQDGPHLRIGPQQDLQILIAKKLDLAAHVAIEAVHAIQVDTHLRQVVGRLSRQLLAWSWR
jgi:hypothetical protein